MEIIQHMPANLPCQTTKVRLPNETSHKDDNKRNIVLRPQEIRTHHVKRGTSSQAGGTNSIRRQRDSSTHIIHVLAARIHTEEYERFTTWHQAENARKRNVSRAFVANKDHWHFPLNQEQKHNRVAKVWCLQRFENPQTHLRLLIEINPWLKKLFRG